MKLKNCMGVTLIELMVAMTVGSIVVSGAYQANQYFTQSTQRENEKAILERDLITTCEVLEKDLRMSGYGLPWNGLRCVINSNANDEIIIYSNMKNDEATLSRDCSGYDEKLFVTDASMAVPNRWISVSGSYSSIVRKIKAVGINPSGDDTISFWGPFAESFAVGKKIFFASRSRYFIKTEDNGAKGKLVRRDDDKDLLLGSCVDTLDCLPMDSNGTFLTNNFITAEKVKVALGGKVGKGSSQMSFLRNTEVNIRN